MDQDLKISNNPTQKNTDTVSFFSKDAEFVFVFKKTEKLSAATYMITSLFNDHEPMKWALRKKSSDLLTFILGYKDMSESSRFDFVHKLKNMVLEQVSLLEVLAVSGTISQMNFDILKQEFIGLVTVLETSNSSPRDTSNKIFSDGFFAVDRQENTGLKNINPISNYSQISNPYLNNNQPGKSLIRDEVLMKEKDVFKRTNRQNIIIGLLKKKKELTIKDIAQTIKDCSEKTIQRELISLISLGVIKRAGERRWSKYSLIPENVNS